MLIFWARLFKQWINEYYKLSESHTQRQYFSHTNYTIHWITFLEPIRVFEWLGVKQNVSISTCKLGSQTRILLIVYFNIWIKVFAQNFTGSKLFVTVMWTSRKYPYSPHRKDWYFLGGGWLCKTQEFKEMCEARLEFSEEWGVLE